MARNFNELRMKMPPEQRERSKARASEMIRLMALDDRSVFTVFTGESLETMADRGGTGNWKASTRNVGKCQFVIATRNAESEIHPPNGEAHRSAFLIGRNESGDTLTPRPSAEHGRVIVEFDQYADLRIAEVWQKDQCPFRYFGLAELMHWGIDTDQLDWKPLREIQA